MRDMPPDLVCGCGASDIPGVTGCSAECMQPAPTPDLDAIRSRLKDVYRPTFGLTKWSSDIGLHFAANTANITPERADRLTWAITFVPADVAALMAWGEHLAAELAEARSELTAVRIDRDDWRDRAHRMRAAVLGGGDGGE